jgi:hypothetical protein
MALEFGHVNFKAVVDFILYLFHKLLDVWVEAMRDSLNEVIVEFHFIQVGVASQYILRVDLERGTLNSCFGDSHGCLHA